MKKISIFPVALVAILFFFSCSKKSSPAPTCRISGVINDFGNGIIANLELSYDNDGRISVLKQTNPSGLTTRVFTYIGNTVLITTTSTTTDAVTDSIVLNSDGMMVSDLQRSGPNKTFTTYTYSGTLVQKVVTQINNALPTTVLYVSTNGDVTSSSDGNTYLYNTSKPAIQGDYLQVYELTTAGAPFLKNAHLLTGLSAGPLVQNYSYSYDNTGKITGVTVTDGSTVQTLAYQYQCN